MKNMIFNNLDSSKASQKMNQKSLITSLLRDRKLKNIKISFTDLLKYFNVF